MISSPLLAAAELSVSFISLQTHQKAEEVWQETVKKFSQDPVVWQRFAQYYFRRGQLEAARSLLPRSLKSLPKNQRAFRIPIVDNIHPGTDLLRLFVQIWTRPLSLLRWSSNRLIQSEVERSSRAFWIRIRSVSTFSMFTSTKRPKQATSPLLAPFTRED